MHLIVANICKENMVWCQLLFQERKQVVGVIVHKRILVSSSDCICKTYVGVGKVHMLEFPLH